MCAGVPLHMLRLHQSRAFVRYKQARYTGIPWSLARLIFYERNQRHVSVSHTCASSQHSSHLPHSITRPECIKEFELQEELIVQGVAGTIPGRDPDGFCLSVALNENMGHCLSSMNRLEDAERRFTAALRLMRLSDEDGVGKEGSNGLPIPKYDVDHDVLLCYCVACKPCMYCTPLRVGIFASGQSCGSAINIRLNLAFTRSLSDAPPRDDIGGVLVGLGLVKDRLGDADGAVSVLRAAVVHYRRVHGEDGSTLIGKALTSLGRCEEMINKDEEAGVHFEEVRQSVFHSNICISPALLLCT